MIIGTLTIAFTICCNNFLGQAKTMLRSLERNNPHVKTFIFLVDKPAGTIDYREFAPAEIIFVDEKLIPAFPALLQRYNIVELNTALRPSVICYLQAHYPAANKLFYLDPDLVIYDSLEVADDLLDSYDIIITPHFLTPLPIDGCWPFENLALNYGTYNMGFLALNLKSTNTNLFLDWWRERTNLFGHIDLANGYFTDQIWFNLVPIFFDKVHTLLHPGYNMAAWNLHERSISAYGKDGKIMLASGEPLVIFHFSSWSYRQPGVISNVYDRFDMEARPDLEQLYKNYATALQENGIEHYSAIPCVLPHRVDTIQRSKMKKMLSPGVDLMRKIWNKI